MKHTPDQIFRHGSCPGYGTVAAALAWVLFTATAGAQGQQVGFLSDIKLISGTPGTREVQKSTRVVTRYVTNRKKVREAYQRGLDKGHQQALAGLKDAPSPMVSKRQAILVAVKTYKGPERPHMSRDTFEHHQMLEVRFVDPNNKPLDGLMVTPEITLRDEQGNATTETWEPKVTDANGNLRLEEVPIPCTISWKLPNQDETLEWSFMVPAQADVAIGKYEGDVRVEAGMKMSRRMPPLAPAFLRVALAPMKLKTAKPASKPAGKPVATKPKRPAPARPTPAAKGTPVAAIAAAQAAHESLEAGRKLVERLDERLVPQDDDFRKDAREQLLRAKAKAEEASRLAKYRYDVAYEHIAYATYWLEDKYVALAKLDAALKILPASQRLKEARRVIDSLPDRSDRLTAIAGRRLDGAEKTAERDAAAARADFERVLSEADEALRLKAKQVRAYEWKARALLGLDRRPEARKAVTAGLGLFPADDRLIDLARNMEPPAGPKHYVVHFVRKLEPVKLMRHAVDLRIPAMPGLRIAAPKDALAGQETGSGEIAEISRMDPNLGYELRINDFPFEKRSLALKVTRELPGGEQEGLIRIDRALADPYKDFNLVPAPGLSLVRLSQAELHQSVDVLATEAQIERALGREFDNSPEPLGAPNAARKPPAQRGKKNQAKPPRGKKGEKKDGVIPVDMESNQSWWGRTDLMDFHFRVRMGANVHAEEMGDGKGGQQPLKGRELENRLKENAFVDLIRLKEAEAGQLGGIRVGDPEQKLRAALGEPERVTAEDGRSLCYLNDGVVFEIEDGTVEAIQVRRTTELLKTGTTAFAPRTGANIYIEEFAAEQGIRLRAKEDLTRFLENTGVLKVVEQKDDADYLLRCRLSGIEVKKGKVLGVLPLEMECTGGLVFDLENLADPRLNQTGIRLESQTEASWKKEAGISTVIWGLIVGLENVPDLVKLLGTLGFGANVVNIEQSVKRAANRAPRLVEQDLYDQLAGRLYDEIDFQARVQSIDYETGELVVPLGTRDGVTNGNATTPATAFDVYVGHRRLPGRENGFRAEYYAAEVIEAKENECRCRLVQVDRKLSKSQKEDLSKRPAMWMLNRLPDAGTAMVSVRMRPALPLGE